jgi:MFS family permease
MKKEKKSVSQWKQVFQGNVLAFGWVSLLTDLSTEMIYPLLPAFFSGLVPSAAVAVYIGMMEGLAESTASLLKFYAGHLSDRLSRRKPLALTGYAISSVIRPFTAIATAGWQVLVFRLCDRVGKGIRTVPRDALLSESVTADVRGRAFSFHRLMDHAGPVEMVALRWLFGLAALPGLAATIALWRLVRERPRSVKRQAVGGENPPAQRSTLHPRFFLFLIAVALFTLGNS